MKKYVIANWKMKPQTWAEAEGILDFISGEFNSKNNLELSLVICPPFVFLEDAARKLSNSNLDYAELGAQDLATDDSIALTGGISGAMLSRLGARYVIVGHSERRWPSGSEMVGESNEIVNLKLKQALRDELTPIVCVGERERGGDYVQWLKQQVGATFAGLSGDEVGKCLVAYEPVWAISTNPGARPDTPESALESVSAIREFLERNHAASPRILYGGSITQSNAEKFLSLPELAGVIVGGASVRKEEFVEILKTV